MVWVFADEFFSTNSSSAEIHLKQALREAEERLEDFQSKMVETMLSLSSWRQRAQCAETDLKHASENLKIVQRRVQRLELSIRHSSGSAGDGDGDGNCDSHENTEQNRTVKR